MMFGETPKMKTIADAGFPIVEKALEQVKLQLGEDFHDKSLDAVEGSMTDADGDSNGENSQIEAETTGTNMVATKDKLHKTEEVTTSENINGQTIPELPIVKLEKPSFISLLKKAISKESLKETEKYGIEVFAQHLF